METILDHEKLKQFERACILWSRELQHYIYSMTRQDPFAAEEIYQETMVEALLGLPQLRDNAKMKKWVFSIAKAEARRHYAADTAAHCTGNDSGGEQKEQHFLGDFTKRVEDREYIRALLRGLNGDERLLYILHYYCDIPLKEISRLMDANYSTIRSMHVRGMFKMRGLINK